MTTILMNFASLLSFPLLDVQNKGMLSHECRKSKKDSGLRGTEHAGRPALVILIALAVGTGVLESHCFAGRGVETGEAVGRW